jgi:flagellar assembly protein FliH
MRSLSSKVIKAYHLVLGTKPVTVATAMAAWAAGGWSEATAAAEAGGPGWSAGPAEEAPAEAPAAELGAEEAAASRRAAAIRQEAEAEAERLLAEARRQAGELREEVRQEGYQAGFQEGLERGLADGRAKGEAELRATVEEAAHLLTAAVRDKSRIVASSREDVLKLVRKVAEKIIRAEVRLDPAVVERAIDAGLRLVSERSQVVIRVNPEDLEKAREGVPHFVRYFPASTILEVCGDPRVARGGCLIETSGGNVDARLETQLEEVFGKLEETMYGG